MQKKFFRKQPFLIAKKLENKSKMNVYKLFPITDDILWKNGENMVKTALFSNFYWGPRTFFALGTFNSPFESPFQDGSSGRSGFLLCGFIDEKRALLSDQMQSDGVT